MGNQVLLETLPILVVLLTPITVAYDGWIPLFSVFFFFGSIDTSFLNGGLSLSLAHYPEYIVLSFPALANSIAAFWALHRLSQKETDKRRALNEILAVTVAWAVYLSFFFILVLALGRLVVGPLPVPFGPLVAILSRGRILKMTKEIDELQKSPVPMD